MASVKKDTGTFFLHGSSKQFDYVLKLYPQVLKLKAYQRTKKPEELIRLDDWFQNELPTKIQQRGKKAYLEYDELVQAMKWKQTRGKFYPQLSYLIKVNTPRAVVEETKKAFRKLPNLEQALTALSNLKGVGVTMASALLAAAAPDSAPFMADECLMAIPDIESIDYTTKEYLKFVQHIQTTVARLNSEKDNINSIWTPHKVELALWTHSLAAQLQPDLLDGIPTATITSSTTVVETTKGENGDDPIITTTTVNNVDDAESTADENSTDVVTDNESRVDGGDDDIDGELKESKLQITTTAASNNIANNVNHCSNSNSNTSIKPNYINTEVKDETKDTTVSTEQQQPPPVLNGNNTASSTTEQVIAANGNKKNGVEDLIDDSSRSDDSSLEKSVTPIVANDDSDSQTSSIKRSLDIESSESQTTTTEHSEPETKKCKIEE